MKVANFEGPLPTLVDFEDFWFSGLSRGHFPMMEGLFGYVSKLGTPKYFGNGSQPWINMIDPR